MGQIEDIIRRDIISQYKESEILLAFFEALAGEGDNFNIAVQDVLKYRTLNFAEDKNLDVLGVLVGQSRKVVDTDIQVFFGFDPDPLALSFTDLNNPSIGGRYRSASEPAIVTRLLSDGEYRSVISAAIQRNISKCTGDEIILAVKFVLSLTGSIPIVNLKDGNTYYNIYIGRILNPEEKAFLSGLNLLPKPAGIQVGYIEYDYTNYFGFLQDNNSKGFGSLFDQLGIILFDGIFYNESINANAILARNENFFSSDFILINKPIIIPGQCDYLSYAQTLNGVPTSKYGSSLSLNNNILAVGSPEQNLVVGIVSIYNRNQQTNVFELDQIINPNDGVSGDQFGYSVDTDGTTILVGSPYYEKDTVSDIGKLYFFERDIVNYIWRNHFNITSNGQSIQKTGGVNSVFDNWVIMSSQLIEDGEVSFTINQANNDALLGFSNIPAAPNNTNNSAYIEHGIRSVDDGRIFVSESGNLIQIGNWVTGDVFTIKRIGQSIEYLKNGVNFYDSLNLSVGSVWIAGTIWTLNILIEEITVTNIKQGWSQIAELNAISPRITSYLGTSVAVSGDVAWAGAPGDSVDTNGRFYRYEKVAGIWQELEVYPSPFPLSHGHIGSKIEVDLGLMAVSGEDEANGGQVHVYEFIAGVWTLITTLSEPSIVQSNGKFGSSIDIDGNNYTIIVGARLADLNGVLSANGAAFIYKKSLTGVWEKQIELYPPAGIIGTENDNFGWDVAVYQEKAFVSAINNDTSSPEGGEVYQYENTQTGWLLINTHTDNTNTQNSFGMAIDVDAVFLIMSSIITETLQINICSNLSVIRSAYNELVNSLNSIAYYEMNYTANTGVAVDISNSVTQHNGIFSNPSFLQLSPSLVSGVNNKSTKLSVSPQNANTMVIPSHSDFDIDALVGFTVVFLIEIDSLDATLGKVSTLYNRQDYYDIYIQNPLTADNPIITLKVGLNTLVSTPTLNVGQRYHLAFVYDLNRDVKIYVNGYLVVLQSNVQIPASTTNDIYVGNNSQSTLQLVSKIDELVVLKKSLNQSQVLSLSNEALKDTLWITNISWFHHINTVSSDGGETLNTLSKIGGVNLSWDSGAISTRTLIGDGYVEFTVVLQTTQRMLGFTKGMFGYNINNITHALVAIDTGVLWVWESSVGFGVVVGNYLSGDILRVERREGLVKYYQNNNLLTTSNIISTGMVRAAGSIYTGIGSVIEDGVIASMVFVDYPSMILSRNVVGYWRFGDTDNIFRDLSVNGNDGSYLGNPLLGDQGSLIKDNDTSVYFSGANDSARVPLIIEYDLPTIFSIEFWVKVNNVNQPNSYIFNSGTNSHAVIFGYLSQKIEFFSNNYIGDDPRLGTDILINDNSWHHISYTYDGAFQKGYLDGYIVFSLPKIFTIGAQSGDLYWASNDNVSFFFDGNIDEGVLYSQALTDEQVLNSYRLGKNIPYEDKYITELKLDNPISLWRLDDNIDATVIAEDINGYNGTVVGQVVLSVPGLIQNSQSRAVQFFGSPPNYIQINDQDIFSFTNAVDLPFSLEAVVNCFSLMNNLPVVGKTRNPPSPENEWILFIIPDGSVRLVIYPGITGNNHFATTPPGTIDVFRTYHIVATYSGQFNSGKIYVDGLLQTMSYGNNGSPFTKMMNTTSPVLIGGMFFIDSNPNGFSDYFDGVIDTVSIYDKELNNDRISKHYIQTDLINDIYEYTVQSDYPVAYWKMNSITGDVSEADLSGSLNQHPLFFDTPSNIGSNPSLVPVVNNQTSMFLSTSVGVSGAYIPHHPDFNIITGITVECWIKLDTRDTAVDSMPVIMIKGDFNQGATLMINNDSNYQPSEMRTIILRTSMTNNIPTEVISKTQLAIGSVYYVVGMIDGNGFGSIFINGVRDEVLSIQLPVQNNVLPFYMGKSERVGVENKLYSAINHVALYDHIFPDIQVLNHYNIGIGA